MKLSVSQAVFSTLLLVASWSPAPAQQQLRNTPATDIDRSSTFRLPVYERDANPALAEKKPIIQLALLLDTSSSMSGLIRQAKTQLWSMVNAFVEVKKDGVHPKFQVALYEYGSNQLVSHKGYVRRVVALTDNLDEVSEKLMALEASTRSGSAEQCGWVLHQAIEQLGWSSSAGDLKVICIAGNESFAQGYIDFKIPCKMATDADISVNTIFCGDDTEGERLLWKMGAQLGAGSYASIDHNHAPEFVTAPQDSELSRLNADLNDTFVPYTDSGVAAQQRQQLADADAQNLAQSSLSERATLKATRFYRTEDWDLVEAAQDTSFDLTKVNPAALPKPMQRMSAEQQRAHLTQLAAQRAVIKKKISALAEARRNFLQRTERDTSQTLDKAVVDSLKAQARKKKFVEK